MYGRPSRYKITKPERCVYVDETGCNTNCKTDGLVGGQCHIVGTGQKEGARTSASTDIHFTTLAFTSGTGEPIMCAVILKSEKAIEDIPVNWRLGLDATKDIEFGDNDLETYMMNRPKGVSIGGPVCNFNGIEIPTFVCATPNASITSELLAKMLEQIDNFNVFPRSPEEGVPFLLVDGHHSRTRLPFLEYIVDPAHQWRVCIGVPYGTHVWQPHDSTELNGSFKSRIYSEKLLYLSEKPPGMDTSWSTTDIIPLLNRTWKSSLGNKYKAKKSITERGWNPLNYVLLDHPIFQEQINNQTMSVDLHDAMSDINTVNVTTEKGAPRVERAFDRVAKQRALVAGTKKKFEDIRQEGMDAAARAKRYAAITNFTSGKFCSMNQYCISDEVLVERYHAVNDDKTKKLCEKEERLMAVRNKQNTKFNEAARKFFSNKNLLVDDLKSLLRVLNEKNDSPVKKKADELQQQFDRRKHRMSKFNLVQLPPHHINNAASTTVVATTDAKQGNLPLSLFDDLLVAAQELDDVDVVAEPIVVLNPTLSVDNNNNTTTDMTTVTATTLFVPSDINNSNNTSSTDVDIKDDDTVELMLIINGDGDSGNCCIESSFSGSSSCSRCISDIII
jgi:hypothetical protein